jgi:hypothetical protein
MLLLLRADLQVDFLSSFLIPRRLTGQDTIQLRITNTAASQNVNVTVWYRNEL